MEIKSGYKTSEFWMTLIPQILAVGVMFNVIPNTDIDMLVKVFSGIVTGVVSLVTLINYVKGRVDLKREQLSQGK